MKKLFSLVSRYILAVAAVPSSPVCSDCINLELIRETYTVVAE